jgi:hypothetical protein
MPKQRTARSINQLAYNKKYRDANRDELNRKARERNAKNKEARRRSCQIYRATHKDKVSIYNANYRVKNITAINARKNANKKRLAVWHQLDNEINRESRNEKRRDYYYANRDKILAYNRARRANK